MISRRVALAVALALPSLTGGRVAFGQPWHPDLGDGRYKNPVLFADYSDPDVVRVGDDYYMTASSFDAVPGLPILHSKDLVNWRIVGHALPRLPDDFDRPQHGNGVWAPAIRHHAGEFHIYWGDPDRGIYVVKARSARGPWSDPILVHAAKGWIDPAPFWDEDGAAYLVHAYARSRSGIKHRLDVARMSPDGMRLLDAGVRVFEDSVRHPTIEGPKLYKRGGWYYVFAPAGGVPTGWQTVLRSRSPFGPYEDRIVLAQGHTPVNGPHQGAWVTTPDGREDWFLHFQDVGPYGRVVHLQPMRWRADGWPVIGDDPDGDGTGQPVPVWRKPNVGGSRRSTVPATTDELEAPGLGLQWQWAGNPRPEWWSLTARRGALRLFAQPAPAGGAPLWNMTSLLLQKLPGPSLVATARVSRLDGGEGTRAGLVMMGLDYAALAVRRTRLGRELVLATVADAPSGGPERETVVPLGGEGTVELRVSVRDDARCRFAYSLDDGRTFTPIGAEFQAREGRWIGAKVGLFATRPDSSAAGGYADFDWFRIQ
ncbi:MAG: glycoside hydrolase 43 family protein [Gemmatimonadaceae bacterium]